MDGIAAAKAIRQAEEARGEGGGLYVAAMSANSTPESRKQCAECGMNGFLNKPIVREELENVLHAAMAFQAAGPERRHAQVDLVAALDRVGDDRELLHDVAQLFIGDYPNCLAEIRAAIDAQDAAKLEREAHTLKGSVANFGAAASVEAALHLEQLGRSGDLNGAQAGLAKLEGVLQELVPELEAI